MSEIECEKERRFRVDNGHFVMQRDIPGGSKQFRAFYNFEEVYRFITEQKPELRCFYETVFGEQWQKPHFDIDITVAKTDKGEPIPPSMVHDGLLSLLLSCVKDIIGPSLDLTEDIGVYSSHAPDSTKWSYHVIITGYKLPNHIESEKFTKCVISTMKSRVGYDNVEQISMIEKCIDLSVYKRLQQFRLLGCTKLGKMRYKKVDYEYQAGGLLRIRDSEKTNFKEEFMRSLITNVENTILLDPEVYFFEDTKKMGHKSPEILRAYGIVQKKPRDEEIRQWWIYKSDEIMAHLINEKHLTLDFADSILHHTVKQSENGILIMLRSPRNGYDCIICDRRHEHENPFLTLWSDSHSNSCTIEYPLVVSINYKCRRDSTKTMRICSMRGHPDQRVSIVKCFTCKLPEEERDSQIGVLVSYSK